MADIFQRLKDTQSNLDVAEGILFVSENLDCIPANRKMALVEQELVTTEGGELIFKRLLPLLSGDGKTYDYVLLDCPPSLGMVTVNALAASDGVLVPTQAEYLAAKGMEQLLQTVVQIRRGLNPELELLGILPTMVNTYTRDGKAVLELLNEVYAESIGILPLIPYSVRAKEISSTGKSIYQLDRGGKISDAYTCLVSEILKRTERTEK